MNVQIVKKTTMNEEKYLEERLAKHNPFQVPEGYFNSFAEQVMNQLPERQQEARRVLLRPWMYAAACMVVAIFTATLYFVNDTPSQEVPAAVAATSDTYVEDVADYMMADNLDIYACLASEY